MRQQITNIFSSDPKKLFLIDGLGALLSAFLLVVILVRWESLFGIPRFTLYFLAVLPCFFAAYDFLYYFKILTNYGKSLKMIAIVNLLYCLLSTSLATYHYQSITYLGWSYIILEIMIVLVIAKVEWKAATQMSNS